MNMKNMLILSESKYDFKYKNIFSRIPNIEVIEGGFTKLLKILLKRQSFYHIRYIKYKNPFWALLRILIIFFTSKISNSKIIWSCHNIYEHNIPSKRINDILRTIICLISYRIIVFHKDLIKYLPQFARNKVIVASFGNFKGFIENKTKKNKEFELLYNEWLKKRNIISPDIVSISAAKRNNLAPLIEGLNGYHKNALIIAPNHKIKNKSNLSFNIFIYSNNCVEREISGILKNSANLIGYIGHENISVPTSIYMFASYGIPVICLNVEPVNSIINDYKIGEILNEENEIKILIEKIRSNYEFYQKNSKIFLSENSWKKSAVNHNIILKYK